ncbi:transposase [uncultured Jannaschia sp.]|uniref:transposase n=1 Tax=uncultured Jannaschia sp. TaxID=293347 RepID=UPI00260974C2|nr:transposase [uncultured Jannaschia sp.]
MLGAEEVTRILDVDPGPGLKYRAAFVARAYAAPPGPRSLRTAYGGGLRVSEVTHLRVPDIDSDRMLIRVDRGRGCKDRHVMLSPSLLTLLRDDDREARPAGWLFPGTQPDRSDLQANHERGMKVVRLPTFEFIRRFLIHVLPPGFHRIRHTGFLANGICRDRIEAIRRLTDAERKPDQTTGEDGSADAHARDPRRTCPRCGSAMRLVETFIRGQIVRRRGRMPHDPPVTPGPAIPRRRTHHRSRSVRTCAATGPCWQQCTPIRETQPERSKDLLRSLQWNSWFGPPTDEDLSHNPLCTELRPRFPPCQVRRR